MGRLATNIFRNFSKVSPLLPLRYDAPNFSGSSPLEFHSLSLSLSLSVDVSKFPEPHTPYSGNFTMSKH